MEINRLKQLKRKLASEVGGLLQEKIQFVACNIDRILESSKVYITSVTCSPEISDSHIYVECYNKGTGLRHPDIIVEVYIGGEEKFDKEDDLMEMYWQHCDMLDGKRYFYCVVNA